MANIQDVSNKVQRILSQNFQTELGSDGDWVIRLDSTYVRIRCHEWGPDSESVIISVNSLIIHSVPLTSELAMEVAQQGYVFGTLRLLVDPESEANSMVVFEYALLGDYLDEDELVRAVVAIGATADDIDDEWQKKHGGKRTIDQ
tara:strand:- start:304 stop:738 length:435 start_codon:yes stop_codon:yes gene_type:complete